MLTAGAIALAWTLAGGLAATAPVKDDKKETAKDLFGLTKVLRFDLQIPAKEWDKMQPPPGRGFPGGPGGGPGGPGGGPGGRPGGSAVPEKPADKTADVHKGSGFGVEFPWAHGDLTAEGKTYKDLGVRFKGNASYMASARGLKRNLKIDLVHYDNDVRFHGLKSINLNAGSMDPSKARESLSFAVFRAAGVPAPRTAYAEVTLTVAGKYDKEYLGLYTFIEQVDKTFLKDRFKNGKGLLMKPEGVRGIEYLGDTWDTYKGRYRPRHDPSKKEAQRVIDFAKLIHKANDEQFQKEIASYLDVDEFLRFIAANALLSNLDSLLVLGHNFYLYLNPETNKFVFIPWDMDLSLAGFPMAGGPEQQMDLSLNHPHAGENKLIDRLLAMKDVKEQYQKLLKELATTCFTKEKLLQDIEAIEKATKDILAREKKATDARKEGAGGFGPPGGGMFGRSTDLRTFVAKRTESILAQLDGKSKGYVPTMGFGPGGFGPPGGFGIGNFWAKPVLATLDADKDGKVTLGELLAGVKKFFKDSDKNKKGFLDEKALVEGIGRLMPAPGGFGPPGGGPGGRPGGGPGGFGGFGPGNTIASAIVKRADKDKDGKVTLDELIAAAESLFKEADKDKKGKLEEKEIVTAINLLSPPPAFNPGGGFGPGGFGAPPQPGQVLGQNIQDQLKLTSEQKKQLEELQKDVEGRLGKILTDEQKKQLKEIRERGPGGFGPGGFGPPGVGPLGGRPQSEEPKKEEKKP